MRLAMGDHLTLLFNPFFDGRYEDMRQGWKGVVFRDFVAGLVVAVVVAQVVAVVTRGPLGKECDSDER